VPSDTSLPIVIGISSRALFRLEDENAIFEQEGVEAYRQHQLDAEESLLEPGSAFPLVQGLLNLNGASSKQLVEVVIISHNSPELSLRIFRSIEDHGLDIRRAAFTSGALIGPFLEAFGVDLFLSRDAASVVEGLERGIASAHLYTPPEGFTPDEQQIRIAFDGDAVIFSDEAEQIYQSHGLHAFTAHEREKAKEPLPEGPFANVLRKLGALRALPNVGPARLSFALVTARSAQTHERVIRTLRQWGVTLDAAFFMGGSPKKHLLSAYKPHIFFDDQDVHCAPAAQITPAGRVPSIDV
jgi:5'-nucleotidase